MWDHYHCQVPVYFSESTIAGLFCRPEVGPDQKVLGLESVIWLGISIH